jgi:hypothetical protein
MTEAEKQEIVGVLTRLYEKSIEVSAMMKDGKFIVAHEKLGGIIKVLHAFGNKIAVTEPSLSSESSVSSV